jgi:uncharacterized membrane protein YkoI
MKIRQVAIAILFCVGGLCATVRAEDIKIKRSDLPPAVEATVSSQSEGASVRGFSMEKENGKTFYEAEMIVNGHTRDILMDSKGEIVEVEEEVAMAELTPDVKTGLLIKAGSAKIVKIESIVKKGQLVAYEAQIEEGAKKSEIQVGPEGKTLRKAEQADGEFIEFSNPGRFLTVQNS